MIFYQWEKNDDKIKEIPRFCKVVMSKSEHLHEHLRRENYNKPGERKTGSEDFLHFGREAGIVIIMRDLWSACLSSNRAVLRRKYMKLTGFGGKFCSLAFKQISLLPIHGSWRRKSAYNMNQTKIYISWIPKLGSFSINQFYVFLY